MFKELFFRGKNFFSTKKECLLLWHFLGLFIFISGLILSSLVIYRQYCSTCDSLQWMGPVANKSIHGIFSLPMMGGFESYSQTYGHHWFLYPLLRAFIVDLLPWGTWTEVTIQMTCWILALFIAARHLFKSKPSIFWLLMSLGLLCPLYIKCQRLGRIEPAVALCVIIHFSCLQSHIARNERLKLLMASITLAVLICMHPMGIALSFASLLFCLVHKSEKITKRNSMIGVIMGIVFGCLGFVSFYWFNDDAMQQLSENIAAQSLNKSFVSFVQTWMRGEALTSLPFILVGAAAGVLYLVGVVLRKKYFIIQGMDFGIIIIIALAFVSITLNPNFNYMVVCIPLLFSCSSQLFRKNNLCKLGNFLKLGFVAGFAIYSSYFVMIFYNSSGMRSGEKFKKSVFQHALAKSEGSTILLPLNLWEVAMGKDANVLFNTFPNVSRPDTNAAYEEHLLDNVKSGTILILGSDMVGNFRESDRSVFGLIDQRYPGGAVSLQWMPIGRIKSDALLDFYALEFYFYRLE